MPIDIDSSYYELRDKIVIEAMKSLILRVDKIDPIKIAEKSRKIANAIMDELKYE